MFNWVRDLLYYVYHAISWILLRWHDFWDWALPDGQVLGTTFDWVLAIVFLVLTVRVVLFPLFVKQIKSQRAMQSLQPQMKALQEKHKGDRETLQREIMALYQKEGANPLMGCLPMLLQIPVFFGMFHILKRIDPFQKVNTTLYGWTQDQWDSAVQAKLFGAPIGSQFLSSATDLAAMNADSLTVKIVAAALGLTMIVTTYLTARQMILKTGWSEDPTQLMMQRLMVYGLPISLLFSAGYFPIGVVIYWTITNFFSLGQQYWVLHKYPPPSLNGKTGAKAPAKATGKLSMSKGKDGAANGEEPKLDGKALAPKPGVKPANPRKSNRKRKARR